MPVPVLVEVAGQARRRLRVRVSVAAAGKPARLSPGRPGNPQGPNPSVPSKMENFKTSGPGRRILSLFKLDTICHLSKSGDKKPPGRPGPAGRQVLSSWQNVPYFAPGPAK
jgi:hypothetical protein